MATISNTPRPGYVWDSTDNVWYPIGTGPHTHAYIPEAIVDAKGDLISATANDTPARLPVGSNGETLVADSSTSTGLRWQGNYAAGKNKIINGDFNINQRGFTSATSSGYGFDRWRLVRDAGGTVTMSAQTFTLGTAPVSGYEGKNFLRIATSGQTATSTYTFPAQKIESVRTFAGETITISFWAKAASGTPKIAVEVGQTFGTGGSPSSNVNTYAGQVTLNTAWTRYSVTVSVPSISGKTIGTNNDDCLDIAFWTSAGSDFNSRTGSLGIQTATIDFWGVQAESGSVATPFQTATGTLAGELAACQRYYWRDNSATATGNYHTFAVGFNATTSRLYGTTVFPVIMRTAATATYLAAANYVIYQANVLTAVSGFTADTANVNNITVGFNVATTPFTAGQGGDVRANNNKTAYIEYSAEL